MNKLEADKSEFASSEDKHVPCHNPKMKVIGQIPYFTNALLLSEENGTRYFVRSETSYLEVFPRKIHISSGGIVLK